MTNTEKEVLKLIQQNPSISQSEISQKLNMTRSSAATHIGNLVKKGYLLGRGYILSNMNPIVVLGGSNITVYGKSFCDFSLGESVPGIINTFGGVGLLTTIELVKFSTEVKFISAIGGDIQGKEILNYLKENNVNTNDIYLSNKMSTSFYLGLLNSSNELHYAVSNMEIFDSLECKFFFSYLEVIKNAKICFIDANIPQEGIDIVMSKTSTKFVLDTVSTAKASRFKNSILNANTLITSFNELNQLDFKMNSYDDLLSVLLKLKANGLQYALVELDKGMYVFFDSDGNIHKIIDSYVTKRETLSALLIFHIFNNIKNDKIVKALREKALDIRISEK
jgi:pseudouridine kinase